MTHTTQLSAWLRHAGLSRLTPRFVSLNVSASKFLQLTSSDFEAFGVSAPADKKRLLDLIAYLRARGEKAQSTTSSNLPHPFAGKELIAQSTKRNGTLKRSATFAVGVKQKPRGLDSMARVLVCVRKRPLSSRERHVGDHDVVTAQSEVGGLCVHELKEKVDLTKYVDTHAFRFDRVFADNATNPMVYERTAKPLVDVLFEGGRGTCFAYGQTGAGKTFTMAGDRAENPGLYTLAVKDVFERIRQAESELWKTAEAEGIEDFEPPEPFQVWISFFEIYASRLQDLLNRSAKLECREDSNNEVQIVGLTERLCEVEEDVLACIDEGSAARATGVTGANDDSSRSHAVFQIQLRHPPSDTGDHDPSSAVRSTLLRTTRSRTAAKAAKARRGAEIGRLCFIDLAGSERGSDTASSTRQTRMEGAEINKSLLALKECIRAMDQKKDHTPFRGSKLTQVLKASFTGKNCSTVMIANISPASSNVEHTLNTLRYSDRVKEIKRRRNADPPPDLDFSAVRSTLGGRRATFSHGIGLRGGRSLLSATPLRTTQRQTSFDAGSEDNDTFLQPPVTERKLSCAQFRGCDDKPSDKSGSKSALKRTGSTGSPSRRTLQRQNSKDLENSSHGLPPGRSQQDGGKQKKNRDGRTTRRRASRAPSMIPSRPSIGGNSLLRPEASHPKPSNDNRMTRKGSKTKAASSADLNFTSSRSERSTRPTGQGSGQPKRARLLPDDEVVAVSTVAATVGTNSSVGSGSVRDDSVPSSRSDGSKNSGSRSPSLSTSSLPVLSGTNPGKGKQATSPKAQRRRGSNAANAAQSAMKHYMTNRKDELPDEDLLFASTESAIDEATVAVQKRLCQVADEIVGNGIVAKNDNVRPRPLSMTSKASSLFPGPLSTAATAGTYASEPLSTAATAGSDPPEPKSTAATAGSNRSRRLSTKTDVGTSPPSSNDNSPGSSLAVLKRPQAAVSPDLKKVLRFHHVQIEELMRLTESDVALVNAAEKGEMDVDEYALKLKLNLSQKLDIVSELQRKLALLE